MRFLLFFAFLNVSFSSLALYRNELNFNDPYSEAMGNISIYSGHVENPSLSTLIANKQLSISYKNHYWTNELSSWRCSFSSPTPWFATGISFSGHGYEHYNSFSLGGNLGKNISSSFAIGVGIDVHSLYYVGCAGRKNNLSVRIGASFNPQEKLLVSCWIANPFQTGFHNLYNEKEKLPVQVFSGFRLFLTEETQWSVEVENNDFSYWKVKTGFEYRTKSFAIRCGVFGKPVVPTAGVGFFFSDFSLDLSGQYHYLLGISIGCGLRWKF
jgi:hypothetical protein